MQLCNYMQLYDGYVWQFQLYATKCNYMQLCWYYIATYATILQQFCVQLYANMQLYATMQHATYAT